MKKKVILTFILSISLLATGCAAQPLENTKLYEAEDEVVKFTTEDYDLGKIDYMDSETEANEDIEKAILDHYDYEKKTYSDIWYYYNFIDLNDDGKDEAVVFILGPSISVAGGSPALILSPDFEVISEFNLANVPMIISDTKTKGYRDIIMGVLAGEDKDSEDYLVHYKFDGEKYPSEPDKTLELKSNIKIGGTAIISNELHHENRIDIE